MAEPAAVPSQAWRFYTLDADLRLTGYCGAVRDSFQGRDMLGKQTFEIHPEHHAEEMGQFYQRVLAGETLLGLGHLHLWQGAVYEVNGLPLEDGGIKVSYRQVLSLDLTSRVTFLESICEFSRILAEWEAQADVLPAGGVAARRLRAVPQSPSGRQGAAASRPRAATTPS